jgi:peroxiredoxin Q/BCP
MPSLQIGDRAPSFTAEAHTGEMINSADYLGKQAVVLYFYPRDDTPTCRAEACGFRDAYEEFVKAGAVVIGCNEQSLARHRAFAAKRNLPFLLISDADGSLRKAFGVPKTWGIFPGRVTYVIDREGIVRLVFNAQFTAAKHIDEALRVVRELAV